LASALRIAVSLRLKPSWVMELRHILGFKTKVEIAIKAITTYYKYLKEVRRSTIKSTRWIDA
jgi:tRNA U54 and U55 pseudouridine synthase Pus10